MQRRRNESEYNRMSRLAREEAVRQEYEERIRQKKAEARERIRNFIPYVRAEIERISRSLQYYIVSSVNYSVRFASDVQGYRPADIFLAAINEYCAHGWIPQGGVGHYINANNGLPYYYQAVINPNYVPAPAPAAGGGGGALPAVAQEPVAEVEEPLPEAEYDPVARNLAGGRRRKSRKSNKKSRSKSRGRK